jgi:type I restriction enzyme S subunit
MKPGYKQTEVGVIPEEWETHRLGELLQNSRSIRYGIVQPGKFESTGCFMLRSQDYSKGWAGPDGMHKASAQLENQYRNARIKRNDLVITVVGAGIGQVVVVPDWLDGAILSRSTARIAIDEDKAASNFVRAFLEGPLGKRQILDCQKEGAQPVVSCLDLAKFLVAYPPLPEQRAIATALSDVDALLAALDRLIAKKRDLKQAAMQQLLTGQTRLPGFHGEWEETTLGNIGKFKNGLNKDSSAFGHGSPFVNLMDVFGVNAISSTSHLGLVASTKMDREVYDLRQGDVLFIRSSVKPSGVGLTAVVERDLTDTVYSGFLIRFRDEGAFDIGFKKHCFYADNFRKKIIAASSVSANTNINQNALGGLTLLLPPTKAEQTAIASVLSEMDGELAVLEQRREKTRALKQAMMQELLTGRTRLI